MRQPISTAAWGILFGLLLIVPLVFTGATLEAFETPKVTLLQLSAIGLIALGIVASTTGIESLRWGWREPVFLAVIGFLLSAALSTVLSMSPHVSFFGGIDSHAGLITVLALVTLFVATRVCIKTSRQAGSLLIAPVVAAGLVATYAIVQALKLDPYPWQASSTVGGFVRPFATLGHANQLGGYLVTVLPLAVYFAFHSRGLGRAASGYVATSSVIAIALTLTRGAWLALAVLAVATAIAAFRAGHRRMIGVGVGAVGVAAVVGWFAAGPVLRQGLAERFANFAHGAGRMPLWRSGLAMAAEHPFVGVGLDAFPLAFGLYRSPDFWLTEWNATPTRAHNEIVQILATQGVLGLLALAAVAITTVNSLRRAWRAGPDRAFVLALGASLLAFVIHCLFSFTVAATGSIIAIMVGISSCLAPERRVCAAPSVAGAAGNWWDSFRHPNASTVIAVGSAAAVLAWVGVVRPLVADIVCRRAECASLVDPLAAMSGFEAAVARAPERDLLWFKLSQGARAAARATIDVAQRRAFNDRARVAQQRAVDLVPNHPIQRAHLAHLLLELFRDGQASANELDVAFRDALKCDAKNPELLAEASQSAWALGDREGARGYLRRGMELDPEQANLRALSGLIAMADGQFEEAEHELEASLRRNWHGNLNGYHQALAVWAACLIKLDRPSHAEHVARIVLESRPDWPAPRYTRAYALSMLGRRIEAGAEYRELMTLCPSHPLAAEAERELRKLEP